MNDPRRLLDGEGGEFSRKLLRSWQSREPSADALHQAAVAVGLGAAAFSASSAAAAVSAGGAKAGAASASSVAAKLVLLKWLGVAVLGGAVVVGAVHYGRGITAADGPGASSEQGALSPGAGVSKGQGAQRTDEIASPSEQPGQSEARSLAGGDQSGAGQHRGRSSQDMKAGEGTTLAPGRAQPGPARGVVEGSTDVEGSSSLAKDIRALDRARQALARRDAKAALQALDEHDSGRPTGVLSPEATVLRIEALLLSGDRPAAAKLARRFISAFPSSPHVPRLEAVARGQ